MTTLASCSEDNGILRRFLLSGVFRGEAGSVAKRRCAVKHSVKIRRLKWRQQGRGWRRHDVVAYAVLPLPRACHWRPLYRCDGGNCSEVLLPLG
jgi:hypothetical protein